MDRQNQSFFMLKWLVIFFISLHATTVSATSSSTLFNRDVIQFVRLNATRFIQQQPLPKTSRLDQRWNSQYGFTDWSVTIKLYSKGKCISKQTQHGKDLSKVLQSTTLAVVQQAPKLTSKELERGRFLVVFHYPPNNTYAFLENHGEGKELNGDRVVLRQLTLKQLRHQIRASQAFLLQNVHPTYFGFQKQLNPNSLQPKIWLRTIYSASSLLTLIKISQELGLKDATFIIPKIASFLLKMQLHQGPQRGAFYYAFDIKKQSPIQRVVVGTASKTIFTLLVLYHTTHDQHYITAAKEAGYWLIKRIQEDGTVAVESQWTAGHWVDNNKQSWLYSGQVLSALSRLYATTHERAYLHAAERLAKHLLARSAKYPGLVGDDFRAPNTISTSWLVYAFMDFYEISQDPNNLTLIEQKIPALLAAQIHDPMDAYNDGRFLDTMTSSGNGWLNEVLTEYYPFCQAHHLPSCDRVLETTKHTTRWLLQNTITATNSFDILYPKTALGGFIRNYLNKTIRTDSVCHGINGFINLVKIIKADEKTILLNIQERKFAETLGLLRIGSIQNG